MGELISLLSGFHASIRQLAEETGFDRETVKKRIAARSIVPSGQRGGHPVYRLREVLPALYIAGADGKADPDRLDPYARKAHWQAEHEQLAYAERTRELIPRIEVEQEQARIFKIVGQAFDTLPDILERDCGASGVLLSRVEQALDKTREALYEELVSQDGATDLMDENDVDRTASTSP
jgi:hypothetical protein